MAKTQLRLVSTRTVIGTVPPKRVPNAELRTREYLTEVERLIKAAKVKRHGQRDATMILLAFRHGLRAAEIVDLRWDQVDLGRAPFTRAGFAKMVARLGVEAKFKFGVHPHMLRHARAAMHWRTGGTTHERCRPIWATKTFNTRCDIPSCR